MLIAKQEILL